MNPRPVWRPSLTLMHSSEIGRLHTSAATILGTIGLNIHHREMRRRLIESGAKLVDDRRLTIPIEMIDCALETARQEVVIHNQLGVPVMPLRPHHTYFGTGSDLVYTWDLEKMERRLSTLQDVAQGARLCDALDEIDFVMSSALPHDVPDSDVEPQQYYALLRNTTKPIIMTSFSGLDALERMYHMACVIAGGERAFRRHPNVMLYGQFVSPLQHDLQAVNRLVFCADHGIPLIYIPTIMPGASGPITLAGSLALAVAECLAGLVMHQTQNPGAPFVF